MKGSLEVQRCGGLSDDALEIGNFFCIRTVLNPRELLLGPLDCIFCGKHIDLSFSQSHVGEDDYLGLSDFRKSGTYSKSFDFTVVKVAEFSGFERRHKTGVLRQDAHFTVRSREIDVVHGVRENLFLGCDDIKLEWHLKCRYL